MAGTGPAMTVKKVRARLGRGGMGLRPNPRPRPGMCGLRAERSRGTCGSGRQHDQAGSSTTTGISRDPAFT